MGAEIERADPSAPQETALEDDVPSRFARVRIETTAVRAEVEVPPSQTRRLLATILDVLVVLGSVTGPALTLKAAPAGFPGWATTGTITVQLALLALVAVSTHRRSPATI
ncbi:hypothetical protein [Amycolatopsis sp. Hca4]|uniref:hypothetical protein n=1 Tax=unclassified Amycolatopsis TaxID=2618356 RepID=UPI001591FC89|nr:hypothetical protein [Amycolatopsis sp. Hca4]QKV75385.1 hypothetical protein HUT10_17605 [Amycolatopsis sp. Hca4]